MTVVIWGIRCLHNILRSRLFLRYFSPGKAAFQPVGSLAFKIFVALLPPEMISGITGYHFIVALTKIGAAESCNHSAARLMVRSRAPPVFTNHHRQNWPPIFTQEVIKFIFISRHLFIQEAIPLLLPCPDGASLAISCFSWVMLTPEVDA